MLVVSRGVKRLRDNRIAGPDMGQRFVSVIERIEVARWNDGPRLGQGQDGKREQKQLAEHDSQATTGGKLWHAMRTTGRNSGSIDSPIETGPAAIDSVIRVA